MKRFFEISFLTVVALVLFSCHDGKDKQLSGDLVTNPKSATEESNKRPIMEFERTEFDFGKILQGEVVSYSFRFTNTGNAPLIISGVEKSCGCTASDYPRNPIDPGKSGEIKITYDSKGHHGFQTKVLVVKANTMPAQNVLRIKVEVRTPNQI